MIVKYSSGWVSLSKKEILNEHKFYIPLGVLVQESCSVLSITELIL